MTIYGNAEAFSPGSTVTRPDGSTFVQGAVAGYRRSTLEAQLPNPARSNKLSGISRRPGGKGSIRASSGVTDLVRGMQQGVREVGREKSDDGSKMYITYRLPSGELHTLAKAVLRSSREGNGM